MNRIRLRVVLPLAQACVATLLFCSYQHYQPQLEIHLGPIAVPAVDTDQHVSKAEPDASKAGPTVLLADPSIIDFDELQIQMNFQRATFEPRRWILGMDAPTTPFAVPVGIAFSLEGRENRLELAVIVLLGLLVWWLTGRFLDRVLLGQELRVRWLDVAFGIEVAIIGAILCVAFFVPSPAPDELADGWFALWLMLGVWMTVANIVALIRQRRQHAPDLPAQS